MLLPPCLLVVDDEPASRNALSQALRHAGYLVTLAANGDEALHLIQTEGCYDLAIVDWDLGTAEALGPILCDRLVDACPDQRLLLLSGHTDGDENGRQFAFISKPWREEELIAKVVELLDGAPNV